MKSLNELGTSPIVELCGWQYIVSNDWQRK